LISASETKKTVDKEVLSK